MNFFHSYMSIPVECGTIINHVAFDGCEYFCTIRCKCEVIRFHRTRHTMHCYPTCREYDCICYDYCDHCFWASSRCCHGRLFKLDCSMNEVDCIDICTPCQSRVITGVSFNCCKNTLVVCFPDAVVEVDKCSEQSQVFCTMKSDCIMGVMSLCPGTLLTVARDNTYYVQVLGPCGENLAQFCIPSPFIPANLIFQPCASKCQQWEIYAFVRKRGCYPYLCKCAICPENLGFVPCCCNYRICEECCCGSSQDACTDIMESIAMVETALSHILNAEGEKLQKTLATTDDLDKIMCVNREINKTIVNVTHLEQTLYAKLSALSDCDACCDCGEGCCEGCGEDCLIT